METIVIAVLIVVVIGLGVWERAALARQIRELELTILCEDFVPASSSFRKKQEIGSTYLRVSCFAEVREDKEQGTDFDKVMQEMENYYSPVWLVGPRAESLKKEVRAVFEKHAPVAGLSRVEIGEQYEYLNSFFKKGFRDEQGNFGDDIFEEAGNYYPLGWLTEKRIGIMKKELRKVFRAHQAH